jgi:hypothetical protein
MKKNIKNILLGGILAVALSIISCTDYLNKAPESTVSANDAFKNFKNFQGFTEELYNCIPDFVNRYWTNSFNWGEDEILDALNNMHFGYKIDNGDFWGWQSEYDGWASGWLNVNSAIPNDNSRFNKDLWKNGWYGIRKANIGLANLDKLTEATQEEKNLIAGQLYFFRGWFHFELMQFFGGLPYIDQVLPSDQTLTQPRLHYQECAAKADSDFRRAADLLPINWDNTTAGKQTLGNNDLRINKIMALGYLGKNALWAASPLMNYESNGNRTYDASWAKKAADDFAELLNLVESGQTQYSLVNFSNYGSIFYTANQSWKMPGSTEAIFRSPQYGENISIFRQAGSYLPKIIATQGDQWRFMPTANYVNYYGMANGLPLNDPASGFDKTHPWKDRDPRFYNDIIYDGVKCVQGGISPDANRYAALYTGGNYRSTYDNTGSRTGYLLIKLIPRICNDADGGWSYGAAVYMNVPWMRLADIYLMYAEAAANGYNGANGKSSSFSKTAADAINVIRDRAGVAHVADKFLGSTDAFMGEVRRERAVELAFEAHRFTDLRRWLLLTVSPYTLKTAQEFDRAGTQNNDDPTQNQVANFREVTILERHFSDKHYWLPLKRADVNLYPEFKQNPGW